MPVGLGEGLAIAAVCLLGAISPGPSLAVVIRNTMGGGTAHGLATAWSHAAGMGVYALGTVFGLAAVLERQPTLARALTLAGAGYLLWLGVQALRAGKAPGAQGAGRVVATGFTRSVRDGLAMALLNPKIAVFFVALFSQFVQPGDAPFQRWVMAGIAVVVDGAWYSIVALALGRPTLLARLQENTHWLNRVCGVLFIGIAVSLAFG